MRFLAISCVGLCLLCTVRMHAQSVTVTYDTFMQLDANQRPQSFARLTPTNQADLLREHESRWQRLHAERLTPEQSQILAEAAKFLAPDIFEAARHSDETVKAFMSLEERISRVFTTEEAREAFTLSAYLPQK